MICRTVVKTGNNVYPHLTRSFPMEVEALKQFLGPKNKKNLISGNAGNKKNLHPGRHKFFFFNQFSRDILFPFLVSFVFFIFVLFFLFACCFLKLKMYILIHIQLCVRVSDKKIFTWPISGNKTTFFCLHDCFKELTYSHW